MQTDTAAVRAGEELNVESLQEYLKGKLEGGGGPIEVRQFPGGHSNLTYMIQTGGREYVLRRAPLGPVAPKAHDMAREFRLLAAISPLFPAAPKVYLVCEDPSVIGAVFFLMERRHGVILRDAVPPEFAALPDHPRRISEAFADTLIRLHSIDLESAGLLHLGKPDGFVERQVRGWAERWERCRTEPIPEMDAVVQWLVRNLPASGRPTLVHNDYKLDNVMLRALAPEHPEVAVEAVLDWEMTTIGDPLVDLGLTLCYWASASEPDMRAVGIPAITAAPGWFTRDEFVAYYGEKTGRDMSATGWHEILGVFKLAVIVQQIFYRFYKGQTKDTRFQHFDQRTRRLARTAAAMVEQQA